MKLLTQQIKKQIPPFSSTERILLSEKTILCKFFNPCGAGTWHVIEGEARGDDFLFWGMVDLFEEEFGYFSLKELESLRLPYGFTVERDLYFSPCLLKTIRPLF